MAQELPWTRRGLQIIAADGRTVATIGGTDKKNATWPTLAEAEANIEFILAAVNPAP